MKDQPDDHSVHHIEGCRSIPANNLFCLSILEWPPHTDSLSVFFSYAAFGLGVKKQGTNELRPQYTILTANGASHEPP